MVFKRVLVERVLGEHARVRVLIYLILGIVLKYLIFELDGVSCRLRRGGCEFRSTAVSRLCYSVYDCEETQR